MSRLPRSGGATAAGWGCLPSLFGGCGVAGSAFSPKAELTRSTAGGSGCSLVALVAGSLRDGLPWAVGRRVRYIMTWAGNLHRWPRRSSLSLSSSPPLDSLTGSLRALGLGWIGSAARSPAGRGWSAGRGWWLVVWLGGAVAALAAACLLRSCSVVPALPLACLSACTGAGCSALPSGLAPAGLRRGAAVSGGQAGRWAGMIPLGWWAGAGGPYSSYCTILRLVFRHFSPLFVRLATHKMIDKYP